MKSFPDQQSPILIKGNSLRNFRPTRKGYCDQVIVVIRCHGNNEHILNDYLAADLLRGSAYKYTGYTATLRKRNATLEGWFINQVKKRVVLNEESLIEGLKSMDKMVISPFQFEGVSMEEQVIAFSSADVIIAPHGGALANMIFMLPHSHIIELFPPNWKSHRYEQLAENLELSYQYIISEYSLATKQRIRSKCENKPNSIRCKTIYRDSNFTVNIGNMIENVRDVVTHIRSSKYGGDLL